MASTVVLMGTDAFREGLAVILGYVSMVWNKLPYPLQLLFLIYLIYSLVGRLSTMLLKQEVEK